MATSGKLEGIHQLDKDTYPPADSDDDDSFVVLDTCCSPSSAISVEPISTSLIERSLSSISEILAKQSLQSINLTEENKENMADKTQFVSISGEDIQRSVDNLLAENTRLKDTLAQNNLTMKTQVEKVKTWQEEVLKVQEAHKKKFAEMKKMIHELQAENKKLKSEIEAKENEKQDIKSLETSDVANKKVDNIIQFELEGARQKIKEMEKALDIIITEKQELSAEITGYKAEISNYREELQRSQTEKIEKCSWVMPDRELSDKMEALRLECKQLKQRNETLEESSKDHLIDHAHLQESFERKEKELKSAYAQISDLMEQLEKTKIELATAQENLLQTRNAGSQAINNMSDEIQKLKESNRNLEESLSDMHNQYTALKDAYSQKEMTLACCQFDLQKYTKEKDDLNQKLVDANVEITRARDIRLKELKEKNCEIEALQKKITGIQVLDDEITALRTQLDIYKRDFETERMLRNEIMAEKNRMADELQLLQRRNDQLMEEVDQHRSGFVPVRTEEATTAASPEHSPVADRYACPLCNKRYRSLLLLQDHVEFCLPR